MRRHNLIRHLSAGCIGLALVLTLPISLTAQTQYLDICRQQYEDAQPGSLERLHASLKMTDAYFHYDLDLALQQANQTIELAENRNDRQAIAVCEMDRALITSWLQRPAEATGHFDKAVKLFVEDQASPEYQVHFYTAQIGYEIIRNSGQGDLTEYFFLNDLAAQQCGDPYLILRHNIFSAFNRIFLGHCELTAPEIIRHRCEIERLNKSFGLKDANAIEAIFQAWEARNRGELEAYQKNVELGLELSKRSNNRLDQIFAISLLGQQDIDRKDWQAAAEHFEACLRIANAHQSPHLIFNSILQLAVIHKELKQYERSQFYVDLAEKTPFRNNRDPSNQHQLYKIAFELACEQEDLESIKRYAALMFSPEHMQAVVQTELIRKKLTSQIAQLRQESRRARESFSIAQAKREQSYLAAQQDAQRKIQILAGCALALSIVGLVTALKLSSNRLKRVRQLLSKERASGRTGEEIRKGLELKLNRLQKVESLGLLAGGVAHDFNNLLVGVLGNAEILKMKSDPEDEFRNLRIDQIISSAEKAADLSHQMLAYAGKQRIDRRAADLNQLVSRLLPVLESDSGDVQLEVSYWSLPLVCEIDETQIEQVLMNLVSNAVWASQRRGKILIRTGQEEIDHVDESLQGARICGGHFNYLEVQDFGDGISEGKIERIFEPFYSEKTSGRGLGLAVVYGMVNGHEGLIRADSQPGHGARFRILLPDARPNVTSQQGRSLRPSNRMNSNNLDQPTILVIDDESAVLELTQQLLEINGWNVIVAASGREAIKQVEVHRNQIQCILLDVVMEEMGAQDVLLEFEKRNISLPVVLMSGFSHSQLKDLQSELQVVSILQKPFRLEKLLTAVNEASRMAPAAA